jgi:predicted naringenin-chalcone synthase
MRIEAIGTALPDEVIRQSEAVDLQQSFGVVDEKQARTLRALYRRSRIQTRRSVLLSGGDGPPDERLTFYPRATGADDRGPTTAARMAEYERLAPGLALPAARAALAASGVSPASVTHLVTVSCTGFVSPGVDAALIGELGLRPSVERTHVGFMGCHGALNGLRVARSFVEDDPGAVPLLCAVELCTLHFAYGWDPEMLVANALFADGAAALVGTGRGGAAGSGGAEGDAGRGVGGWRLAASGTLLMPDSAEAMTWRIGDHGFRMTLSARVPELIQEHLRPWLEGWLAERGLAMADIASWAVHPGGPRILDAVESALDLEPEANAVARATLAECGNMSSPTILFILDRMRREGARGPCVALAFGPGLSVEVALLL